jgi:phosphoglycolate phosphatase
MVSATVEQADRGWPVVGFDLDMTLVDSAAGIAATVRAVLAEHAIDLDAEQARALVWPYIGVPMEATLEAIAPGIDAVAGTARYRELYPALGLGSITLLPGAAEAIRAVHRLGGRVLVVSTKVEPAVRAVLAHVGLDGAGTDGGGRGPDLVVGGLFAADKGVRLRAEGADVYVGDHPGDIEAAHVARALAVGVATGPYSARDLERAGADVVLTDLRGLPAWLAERAADRDA